MNTREFSKTLMEAFESSGRSYADLSKATGIPKSMIQRYLTGDVEKIPIQRLEAICEELRLNIEDLLGWDRSKPPKFTDPGIVYRSMTQQQAILFDASKDLSEAEQRAILSVINAFKEQRGE